MPTYFSHGSWQCTYTRFMVTVGHRDFFDINVPQIFLKIWYQCPSSVPPTEHRFYPRMNHHSLHTPYTYILLYCAFSYMKTTLTPNLTLKEKLQEGDMWCPTWLRIWYQVSQSQPQQFDIVPRWLSHCPRKACIILIVSPCFSKQGGIMDMLEFYNPNYFAFHLLSIISPPML